MLSLLLLGSGLAQVPATSGGLRLALPYMPSAFAQSPNGRWVAVVDAGVLAVRDATTLAVVAWPVPLDDDWSGAAFSADSAQLVARTRGGARYVVDTATWTVDHVLDSGQRGSHAGERVRQWRVDPGLTELSRAARLGDLVAERTGARVDIRYDPPQAVAFSGQQALVVAGADDLWLYEGTDRLLESRVCEDRGCNFVGAWGLGWVLGDETGRVTVLDDQLQVIAEHEVFGARVSEPLTPYSYLPAHRAFVERATGGWPASDLVALGETDPIRFMQVELSPDGQRLLWLDERRTLGVFDVGQEADLAVVSATDWAGVQGAFLAGSQLVASWGGMVRAFDVATAALLWEASGPYFDVIQLDRRTALASRVDGQADLLDLRTGDVSGQLCLQAEPCLVERPTAGRVLRHLRELHPEWADTPDEDLAPRVEAGLAVQRISLYLAPDDRTLVALRHPSASFLVPGTSIPGQVVAVDVLTGATTGSATLPETCEWPWFDVVQPRVMVCGGEYAMPDLHQVRPPRTGWAAGQELSGRKVQVQIAWGEYDEVSLGPPGAPVAVAGQGGLPRRRGTMAQVEGQLVLLASSDRDAGLAYPMFRRPTGPLLVFDGPPAP